MKVICKANKGKDLPEKYLNNGYYPKTKLSITIGEKYTVLGIMLSGDIISVLIKDDDKSPFWHPFEAFEFTTLKIPDDWYFVYKPENPYYDINAIWGYKDLIEKTEHNNKLIEGNKEARVIFEKELLKYENYDETFEDDIRKKEEYLMCNYGITLDELKELNAKMGL